MKQEKGFINLIPLIAIAAIIIASAGFYSSFKTYKNIKITSEEQGDFIFGASVSSTALSDTINQFRINTNDNFTRVNSALSDTTSTDPGHGHTTSTVTGVFGLSSGGLGITTSPTDGQFLSANGSTPTWKGLVGSGAVTISTTTTSTVISSTAFSTSTAYNWSAGQTFEGGVTSTATTSITSTGVLNVSSTATFTGTTTINGAKLNGTFTLAGTVASSSGNNLLGGGKVIFATTTDKVTSDPATETYVSTTTIPANTFGTTGGIKVRVKVSWGTSGAGTSDAIVQIRYGGSVVASFVDTYTAATTGKFIGEVNILGNSSTTAQIGIPLTFSVGEGASHTLAMPSDTTSAIDSASAQNLTISVLRSGGTSVGGITISSIEIYKILGID